MDNFSKLWPTESFFFDFEYESAAHTWVWVWHACIRVFELYFLSVVYMKMIEMLWCLSQTISKSILRFYTKENSNKCVWSEHEHNVLFAIILVFYGKARIG